MSDPEPHTLRKGRLAVAYLLFTIACVPGVLTFFFVRNALPEELLHPSRLVWLAFISRLLVQVAASAIVLFMLLLPTLNLIQRFLSKSEYKHFQLNINEMQI